MLSDEDACRYDAVVLVDRPGVCAFLDSNVLLEVARSFPLKEVETRFPPRSQNGQCISSIQFPWFQLPIPRPGSRRLRNLRSSLAPGISGG